MKPNVEVYHLSLKDEDVSVFMTWPQEHQKELKIHILCLLSQPAPFSVPAHDATLHFAQVLSEQMAHYFLVSLYSKG